MKLGHPLEILYLKLMVQVHDMTHIQISPHSVTHLSGTQSFQFENIPEIFIFLN